LPSAKCLRNIARDAGPPYSSLLLGQLMGNISYINMCERVKWGDILRLHGVMEMDRERKLRACNEGSFGSVQMLWQQSWMFEDENPFNAKY